VLESFEVDASSCRALTYVDEYLRTLSLIRHVTIKNIHVAAMHPMDMISIFPTAMVSINLVGSDLFQPFTLRLPRKSGAVRLPQLQSLSIGGRKEELCPIVLQELLAGSGPLRQLELASTLPVHELQSIVSKGFLSELRRLHLRSWGYSFSDEEAELIASKQG